MRNVLIYLDVETKKTILSRVARVLAPDGYLVLGGAETTTGLNDSFESVSLGGGMCFRLKDGKQSSVISRQPPVVSRQPPAVIRQSPVVSRRPRP